MAFSAAGADEVRKVLEAFEPVISFFIDRHDDRTLEMDMSLRIMPGAFVSRQWLAGFTASRQQVHASRDGNDDLCLLVSERGQPIHMRMQDRGHGRDEYVVRHDAKASFAMRF